MLKSLKISRVTWFITTAWFLIYSFPVYSQGVTVMHFDRPFYLNGDQVHFKIYSNELVGTESYLELQVTDPIDEDERYKFFIHLKDEIGFGSFLIPHTAKTSVWRIQARLFDSNTFRFAEVFRTGLQIINDTDKSSLNTSIFNPQPVNPTSIIKIRTDKPVYNPGEQVSLEIRTQEMRGSPIPSKMSISVSHRPYLESHHNPISSVKLLSVKSLPISKNALTWSRRLLNKETGRPVINDLIALFFKDEGKIELVKVDSLGVFFWHLPPFAGNKRIQYFDPKDRDIQIVPLHENNEIIPNDQMEEVSSFDLSDYFRISQQKKKIKFLFNQGADSTNLDQEVENWSFEPDYTIFLENYENVRSIEELTKLILTPLRIRKSGDRVNPRLVNPINKPFFNGPPLFVIDRCLEPDPLRALSIKMEHVIRIDFYNLPQTIRHFGHLGRNGVVSISTKFPLANQRGVSEIINGIVEEKNNLITLKPNQDFNMPAIDPLVHWNPDVRTDQNGRAQIMLKQSDDLGTFVIEVFAHGPKGVAYAVHRYQVVAR